MVSRENGSDVYDYTQDPGAFAPETIRLTPELAAHIEDALNLFNGRNARDVLGATGLAPVIDIKTHQQIG
jgi:hypothetical protein